jgi:putative MATE family efflux protein
MQQDKIRTAVLSGRMHNVMLKLSIPSIIGFLFYGLNNLLDGIFVGFFLGEESFAGLTLAYPVVQLLSGFGLLVGMGAANLLSMAIGRKDDHFIRNLFGNTVALSLLLGMCITLPGYLGSEFCIQSMGGDGEALIAGTRYLEIIFLGAVFNLVSGGMNLLLRGEGNMMTAMKLFGFATLINSILTPIFIYNLELGVEGAAWATNLSYLFSTLLHWLYFLRNSKDTYALTRFKLSIKVAFEILRMGVPSTLLNLLIFVQHYFILNILRDLGGMNDIAFFGAINRILMFSILPVYGMSRALQPVTGIAYGAGEKLLARKAFWSFTLAGSGIMFVVTVGCLLFSRQLLPMLLPGVDIDDQHILWYNLLISSMLLMPLLVFAMTFIQACGKAAVAAVLVLARQILLFIPLVYLLLSWYAQSGIYVSFILVDFLLIVPGIFFIYRFTSPKKSLSNQHGNG